MRARYSYLKLSFHKKLLTCLMQHEAIKILLSHESNYISQKASPQQGPQEFVSFPLVLKAKLF